MAELTHDEMVDKIAKLSEDNRVLTQTLQEIKEYINSQGIDNSWNMRIQRFRMGILDLITKVEEK